MQESPEATEPSTLDTNDHAPLSVRVIAGLLLISGTCTLIEFVLDLWTGRGMRLDLGIGALLIGWGLLRRRDWARRCVVIFTFLAMVLGTLFVVVAAVGSTDNIQFNPAFNALGPFWKRILAIAFSIVYVAIAWAVWRMSRSDRVCQWFKLPPIQPFIVWNPKRWQFGLGTLFYLTVVVAFATMNLMVHPAIREMQLQAWVANQDLTDSVYFPNGAPPFPKLGQRQFMSTGGPTGLLQVSYRLIPTGVWGSDPRLDLLVFERTSTSTLSSALIDEPHGPDEIPSVTLTVPGYDPIRFPGDVQVAELVDGKLETSDLRLTPLEFWSYWNHPDAEHTLADLETYIKDLRRRVAERDAKNSHP